MVTVFVWSERLCDIVPKLVCHYSDFLCECISSRRTIYIYTHQIAYKSFFYIIVYTFHVSANHYDKSSFWHLSRFPWGSRISFRIHFSHRFLPTVPTTTFSPFVRWIWNPLMWRRWRLLFFAEKTPWHRKSEQNWPATKGVVPDFCIQVVAFVSDGVGGTEWNWFCKEDVSKTKM